MGDPSEPVVRVMLLRRLVEALERLDCGRDVMEHVGEDLVAHARQAPSMGWLPFEYHAVMLRALWSVVGDVGFKAHYRRLVYDALESPLLGPLWETAVRSFGREPSVLFRLLPRANYLCTRHTGIPELAARPKPHSVTIRWRQVCASAREVPWVALQEVVCLAAVDMCQSVGEVRTDTSMLGQGELGLTVTWRPASLARSGGWLSGGRGVSP